LYYFSVRCCDVIVLWGSTLFTFTIQYVWKNKENGWERISVNSKIFPFD
jgi:hypothetical protein